MSGSGPTVAFLCADEEDAVNLTVGLSSFPSVRSVLRAKGPVPGARVLSFSGLYGAFLLYRGLPRLMQNDDERTMAFAATLIVMRVVLIILAFMLGACVVGFG